MSEEQNAPVEQNADNQNLVAELEAMRRKNAELLDEYKKAKQQAKAVPDGVDVQELLDFKKKCDDLVRQAFDNHISFEKARDLTFQDFFQEY